MDKKELKNLQAFTKGKKQPNKDAPSFIGQPTGTGDDELDLSKAELFANSAQGIYIPQFFVQSVKRHLVTGISDEDYKVLGAGPDHEHYWDAWADVLDNASINDPKLGKCYLHQDGDLWVVPVEKEAKIVLGHTFVKMEKDDYEGFAGADEGSFICHLDGDIDGSVLILSPDGSISEIGFDEAKNESWQYDWKKTKVL